MTDDPGRARHRSECPHPPGSDAWKRWNREFAVLQSNGKDRREALEVADERIAAVKADWPARSNRQVEVDALLDEMEHLDDTMRLEDAAKRGTRALDPRTWARNQFTIFHEDFQGCLHIDDEPKGLP